MSIRTEQLALPLDDMTTPRPAATAPVDVATVAVVSTVGHPRLIYVQSWRSVSRWMANRYGARRHAYCGRCKQEIRDRSREVADTCPHCGALWNGERTHVAKIPTLSDAGRPNSDANAQTGIDAQTNEKSD